MSRLSDVLLQGTHAARPAAATGNTSYYYWESDTQTLFQSTGSAWVQLAPAVDAPSFSGEASASDFKATGLSGATAATRYVGGTTTGHPSSGTFTVGDYVPTQDGHVFICTVAGTPGTWVDAGSAGTATFSGARYYGSTAHSIAANTATIVNFDTQDYDTGSFVTTGAAWKFTAAAAGYYHVQALVTLDSGSWNAGAILELDLFKNGSMLSVLMRDDSQATSTRQVGAFGSDTVHLAAADYIDIRLYQASNAALSTQTAAAYDHVAITKVG